MANKREQARALRAQEQARAAMSDEERQASVQRRLDHLEETSQYQPERNNDEILEALKATIKEFF
ncbi:MAG: hypothetical protein AAGF11_30940 [Myxococcota bacterium]